MQQFESDILKDATIDGSEFCISGITINSGEYSEQQTNAFIAEIKSVLFHSYSSIESLDLSNIELSNEALREIFRIAGTANITVNKDSDFYGFLESKSELSETCIKRLGIGQDASNLQIYKRLVELKRSSFRGAIIPAKDLLKISEYIDLRLAVYYNISLTDLEDAKAIEELMPMIKPKDQIIFKREGIDLGEIDLSRFRVISNVKKGNVTLSKEEALFYTGQTTNERYKTANNLPEKLDAEELILGAMRNVCIPARALSIIGNENLEGIDKITLAVQTEEDRKALEEYKATMLQGKSVTLASSTVAQMPLEILDGLNIERIMVGIDQNENGKYDVDTYKKIYSRLQETIKGVDGETDYDKFQAVYERLAKSLKYDYKVIKGNKEFDEEHSRQAGHPVLFDPSVGRDVSRLANLEALVNEGETVCQGFAEVLRQTLSMLEIKSDVICGGIEGSGHAWNRVVLEGKLYNCDLTWDEGTVNRFGIYKKARPRRVIKNNPKLSKKIMPAYYLKSDKEFEKDHTPFHKPEQAAEEDFDADSYYRKDFRTFLKHIFDTVSTRVCKTAEVIMGHDIEEWERSKGIKEEKVEDDRSL